MELTGYLSEQVMKFKGAAGAATAGTAVASNIYDLSKLGFRGVCVATSLLTFNAGNYLEIRGTNTVPTDGTEANGVWSGSTAITTGAGGIAGSKITGAANGDLLVYDCKNFPYRFLQAVIIRAGANSVTEQISVDLYNPNKTPVTQVSTTVVERANAPIVGTI